MNTTALPRKKKLIELPEDAFKRLSIMAVAEGKKWPYVADKSVYEHEKWKGADWAEV